MNITEETLVGVENGRVNLTDYALEVGVRFHVQVENPDKETIPGKLEELL